MREVTLDELKTLTENARESLWDIAKPYGRDPKIYLHWSAGHYGQFYDDYHVNIDSDGSYHLSSTSKRFSFLSWKLHHFYSFT